MLVADVSAFLWGREPRSSPRRWSATDLAMLKAVLPTATVYRDGTFRRTNCSSEDGTPANGLFRLTPGGTVERIGD